MTDGCHRDRTFWPVPVTVLLFEELMKRINLLKMFSDYEPPEDVEQILRQAVVLSADIDTQRGVVFVRVDMENYVPARVLDEVADEIAEFYGLDLVILDAVYPPDQIRFKSRASRRVYQALGQGTRLL